MYSVSYITNSDNDEIYGEYQTPESFGDFNTTFCRERGNVQRNSFISIEDLREVLKRLETEDPDELAVEYARG